MNVIRLSLAAILAIAPLRAQSNPARVEFEVASIKPSPSEMPDIAAVGLHIDGAQVRARFLQLRVYLAMAYRLPPNQIMAPAWTDSERFDIAAKIPDGVKADRIPEMFQALLEERFQLRARRDKKELPVYGLVVAKGGLRIKPLPPDPDDAPAKALAWKASGGPDGFSVTFGRGASLSLGGNRLEIRKVSMGDAAEALSHFTDRPVIDMTDAQGKYDFTLELTPGDYRAIMIRAALNRGVTLPVQAVQMLEDFSVESTFLALQTVGLRLESRNAPLDVLIVESIAKTPTAN